MIKLKRPATTPAVLKTKGKAATSAMKREYLRHRAEYDSGEKVFEFDKAIYGHDAVKSALIKMHHGKCAFCESRFRHVTHGDVEHFRPKAGAKQKRGSPPEKPGYYWLAYEWKNLLLSCSVCNQSHKGNFFPLEDPGARARNHTQALSKEKPLFVNPASEDPSPHIGFREEVAFPVGDSPRGRAMIEMLGLNRTDLLEFRRDVLQPLQQLRQSEQLLARLVAAGVATEAHRSLLAEIRETLARSVEPAASYSAMMRAALGE